MNIFEKIRSFFGVKNERLSYGDRWYQEQLRDRDERIRELTERLGKYEPDLLSPAEDTSENTFIFERSKGQGEQKARVPLSELFSIEEHHAPQPERKESIIEDEDEDDVEFKYYFDLKGQRHELPREEKVKSTVSPICARAKEDVPVRDISHG